MDVGSRLTFLLFLIIISSNISFFSQPSNKPKYVSNIPTGLTFILTIWIAGEYFAIHHFHTFNVRGVEGGAMVWGGVGCKEREGVEPHACHQFTALMRSFNHCVQCISHGTHTIQVQGGWARWWGRCDVIVFCFTFMTGI